MRCTLCVHLRDTRICLFTKRSAVEGRLRQHRRREHAGYADVAGIDDELGGGESEESLAS